MMKNQPTKKRATVKQQNPSNDSSSKPSRKENQQVSFKETAVVMSPPGSATGASDLSTSVKRHSSVAVSGLPAMAPPTVSSTNTSPQRKHQRRKQGTKQSSVGSGGGDSNTSHKHNGKERQV